LIPLLIVTSQKADALIKKYMLKIGWKTRMHGIPEIACPKAENVISGEKYG